MTHQGCCKDCTKRHLHCHSDCEDYAELLKENAERNEKIRKAKEKEQGLREYDIYVRTRYLKRKGKRK